MHLLMFVIRFLSCQIEFIMWHTRNIPVFGQLIATSFDSKHHLFSRILLSVLMAIDHHVGFIN